MKTHTPAQLKKIIVDLLKEHKAIDVKALKITDLTDIADYMIITTANSTIHAKTLSEKLCGKLAALNIKPIGIEGEDTKEWILIDFGDIIVHIMLEDTRKFYDLEKLWDFSKKKIKRGKTN